MPGTTPTIYNPTPPGGQLYASESALPQGSTPGQFATHSSFTFTITAQDGVGDLTVAGYQAIRAGVFTAGSVALSYGRLDISSYDAASGTVAVGFTLTAPSHSNQGGGPQRYGDLYTFPILLTDRDGDQATSTFIVDIRDDDFVDATDNETTATVGAAASGNLLSDGTPDRFSADGSAGVVQIWDTNSAFVGVPLSGAVSVHGRYGTLSISNSGAYSYTPDTDAPAGVDDRFIYWAQDGDGDRDQGTLTIHVQRTSASNGGDDVMTGSSLMGGAGNDTLTGTAGQDFLRGEDGNDKLIGGDAFDDMHGNMGNDTLYGGFGDDWVVGGKDQDQLFGEEGGDVVLGNLGEDTVDGGAGNDVVRGGQGNDVVTGGGGNDFVSGDRGDDTETGGAGADTFHSFADAGLDRITDFNAGEGDRLNLLAGSSWTARQVGADTVVDVSASGSAGAQVVLAGVQLSSLSDGWIFVG